ncbi:hypothetical protein GCM10017774_41840 [Lentzea cavernae]|uniref:Uncharacterized protein n=1 Tax=Lentzea cavernae TaxID=2020703 RepID=A0ABQ3MQL1_9PSEU|nr:hypothetical protein GCM10017774_41840 [Lentzea cavernae]
MTGIQVMTPAAANTVNVTGSILDMPAVTGMQVRTNGIQRARKIASFFLLSNRFSARVR